MKQIKWGILGAGTIAVKFAQGIRVVDNAIPYAVGSRSLERAQEFAREHGFEKAYGSYEDLVKDKELDAVYVATPHPMHEEAVLACLDAGKAVLCEKPFAANSLQAQNMIDRAREKKLFLMEAMWTRFLPATRKAMELIESGAIGRVRHISADFGFRAEVDPTSRLFDPGLAGGALLDVGIYPLAFCSMVFGSQPDTIQSRMEIGETGVDEVTVAQLLYPEGRGAQIMAAIILNTPQDGIVLGEEGQIRMPKAWQGKSAILINKEGERRFDLPYDDGGFQFEIREVMDCLDKGLLESPIMPLDETLALARAMDQIRHDNMLRYPFEDQV